MFVNDSRLTHTHAHIDVCSAHAESYFRISDAANASGNVPKQYSKNYDKDDAYRSLFMNHESFVQRACKYCFILFVSLFVLIFSFVPLAHCTRARAIATETITKCQSLHEFVS